MWSCGGIRAVGAVCCSAIQILANIKLTNINLFAEKDFRAYVRLVAAAAAVAAATKSIRH